MTSAHLPFAITAKETEQVLQVQRKAKRMIGRFLTVRPAPPFLIYSTCQMP